MGTRRARAALRRTDQVRLRPTSGGYPAPGTHRKMGAPPCIWTFLSSLGENEFFSVLLGQKSSRSGRYDCLHGVMESIRGGVSGGAKIAR